MIVAMCGAMLGKNTRGGTVVAGALNLGGSIALEMTPERRPAIGILSALAHRLASDRFGQHTLWRGG